MQWSVHSEESIMQWSVHVAVSSLARLNVLAPVTWFGSLSLVSCSRISSMATNAELMQMFDKLFFWLEQCQPHIPEIQATCPASCYITFPTFFDWLNFWGTMFVQVELIVALRLLHNFQPRWPSLTTSMSHNVTMSTTSGPKSCTHTKSLRCDCGMACCQ